MPPGTSKNVEQESNYYQKQALKSKTFDPLVTSFESFRTLFRGTRRLKPSSKLVTPQGSSADLREADLPLPSDLNPPAIDQGIGAILQDAHHFSIGGNARFVNIGQQNVINRGIYGLDNLKDFVSFSALQDSSAQDPERCCHPGTRESVLNQMRNWADDPNVPERILWLHGPAGVGKSAIAQTISNFYNQDKVGATFFFFRSDPVRNDGNRLFPTLAWRLASSVPVVKDLIALALEKDLDLPRKAIEAQFKQLIAWPFLTISSDGSTSSRVIIIDGLDECSDVKLQRRILKIIGSAVADTRFPLRFIISSRPEAHIEDFFAQFEHPTLQIDLAKVANAYRDIETYLTSEFSRIAVEQALDPEIWPRQDSIDTLVSQSSGQFIYASTIIKYVGDEYESAVARLNVILGLKSWSGKSPFTELDVLYTEILQRQPDQEFLKEFLPILVVRSILVNIEDRNLDDAMLLGIDEREFYRKLRGMHSVLRFEPFLDVYHKSFLDYLDDASRSGEYHVSKHFANRRYMQLITDLLVKVASRAIKQPDSHEGDHFKPKFAAITKHFPFPINLPLDDLEELLQPLHVIQEILLQSSDMSVPWKRRTCEECWMFYMIEDLLLHLRWLQGTVESQESKYAEIRPLTAMEGEQSIPQVDLDACLSLLSAHLRVVELPLQETIGLMRAVVRFDPTETAMKVRSITDAQNLLDLICHLNKNKCFQSWFGATSHKATRLALAIYRRVPLFPRSLFLNSAELSIEGTPRYQAKGVDLWTSGSFVRRNCFDAVMWGSLSHVNVALLLGICYLRMGGGLISTVSPLIENGALQEWQKRTNASVSKIQQIFFEVAKAIQYVHSLGIVLGYALDKVAHVRIDSDGHVKLHCPGIRYHSLYNGQLDYEGHTKYSTMEANIRSFGTLFYKLLFNLYDGEDDEDDEVTVQIRPSDPEIPDNVWELIQWCCAEDPQERPTMDQVVREMESWMFLGQFASSPLDTDPK